MEMQGRRAEGIAWTNALRGNWDAANNLRHHLWWHAAMFHLEQAETEMVLALYDSEFRDLAAPLTQAQPDLYIDAQNAASMLFRLQLHGVDVGDRWEELADKAEARIGDTQSAFTLPHWMMALAATGRAEAASRMLVALRDAAQAGSSHAALVGTIVRCRRARRAGLWAGSAGPCGRADAPGAGRDGQSSAAATHSRMCWSSSICTPHCALAWTTMRDCCWNASPAATSCRHIGVSATAPPCSSLALHDRAVRLGLEYGPATR